MFKRTFIIICLLQATVICSIYGQTGKPAPVSKMKKPPFEPILDKKTYAVFLKQVKKKNEYTTPDEIKFLNYKLRSRVMPDYEFGPSPYIVKIDSTGEELVIQFEADAKNNFNESLKWIGTITGESIQGTVTILNKKGRIIEDFTFTGTQKVKLK